VRANAARNSSGRRYPLSEPEDAERVRRKLLCEVRREQWTYTTLLR